MCLVVLAMATDLYNIPVTEVVALCLLRAIGVLVISVKATDICKG